MSTDYKSFRNLERHIREKVFENFHNNGSIDATDFFCIVIWKANRAKSKVAKSLCLINPNLELCCREITAKIFNATSHEARLNILMKNYNFRLPMSSAILSVFYPDDFSVYDVRVCESLKNHEILSDYKYLSTLTDFRKIWSGYCEYIETIKRQTPTELSLIDRDHYLWGHSFYSQLQKDLESNFISIL